MGLNYFTNPFVFIIDNLFSFYIAVVLVRFLLQWCRADSRNNISKTLINLTHWPLKMIRRFIPAIGNIDLAAILFAFVLQILADLSITLLHQSLISIPTLMLLSIAHLFALVLNIFFYAIFGRALLSWIDNGAYNPLSQLLYSLTEPMLRVCRQMLPSMSGLDLSVIVALMILQLVQMLLLPPIYQLASLFA